MGGLRHGEGYVMNRGGRSRRTTVFQWVAAVGAWALLSSCGASNPVADPGGEPGADSTAPVRNATVTNAVSVPTYNVVSSGLSTAQLAAVNKALDPLMPTGVDLVVEPSGRAGFANADALLVGTKSVTRTVDANRGQDDERADGATSLVWDAAAIGRFQPMSATAMSSLVTTAAASLKQGDVGALVKTSPVMLEVYRPSTKAVTLRKQLATTGARTSKLGAYPLVGPGNAFDLLVGGTGKLAFVNIQQRSYAAGSTVQVPTGSDAVARCKAALDQLRAGASQGVTLSATLVYFAPGLDTKATVIEPALQCAGTGPNSVPLRTYFVRARLDVIASILPVGLGGVAKSIADNDTLGLELGTSYRAANARSPLSLTDNSTADYEAAMTAWGMSLNVDLDDSTPDAIFEPGTDIGRNGADSVDMFWYTGHASAFGWQTDTTTNDMRTMRFGDADLEWLVIAACGPLQETAGTTSWRDRVTPMFGGMHLLMGYASTSNDTAGEGRAFADYSISGVTAPLSIPRPALIAAWIFTAIDHQPDSVTWALAGVQSDNGGTVADCLACGLADIVPSEPGFEVWRLAGAS